MLSMLSTLYNFLLNVFPLISLFFKYIEKFDSCDFFPCFRCVSFFLRFSKIGLNFDSPFFIAALLGARFRCADTSLSMDSDDGGGDGPGGLDVPAGCNMGRRRSRAVLYQLSGHYVSCVDPRTRDSFHQSTASLTFSSLFLLFFFSHPSIASSRSLKRQKTS